jgi:hypothetical protein
MRRRSADHRLGGSPMTSSGGRGQPGSLLRLDSAEDAGWQGMSACQPQRVSSSLPAVPLVVHLARRKASG